MRRPWYRKLDGWWYLSHGGKQIKLSRSKQEAHDKWQLLLDSKQEIVLTVLQICEKYLDHIQASTKPRNYEHNRLYLSHFVRLHSVKSCKELKAFHLTEAASGKKFPSVKRSIIVCVKAAFKWALEQELIERNPFASVKAPPCGRRTATIDPATVQAILAESSPQFRIYLQFLRHTGARPQEIRVITLEHYHEAKSMIVLPTQMNKTGSKTDRNRVIPLAACMQTLMRIAKHIGKPGEIFRSPTGQPWNRNSVRQTFKRLKKIVSIPDGIVAYSMRHTFITQALINGVDIATVAAISGHSSTDMIDRHYGHLTDNQKHLTDAMNKAISYQSSQRSDQRTHGE